MWYLTRSGWWSRVQKGVAMNMRLLLSRRWVKFSAGVVLCLLICLLALAWYFRIWSWRDLQIYEMMSQECHPVWKDLHWGRVRAGQDVEEVISLTKPLSIHRYGEWVQLDYQQGLCFTGITIVATKGCLASAGAWSCTWDRTFFEELNPKDWEMFRGARDAHWQLVRGQQ